MPPISTYYMLDYMVRDFYKDNVEKLTERFGQTKVVAVVSRPWLNNKEANLFLVLKIYKIIHLIIIYFRS
jgi:hypothetical protein